MISTRPADTSSVGRHPRWTRLSVQDGGTGSAQGRAQGTGRSVLGLAAISSDELAGAGCGFTVCGIFLCVTDCPLTTRKFGFITAADSGLACEVIKLAVI